MKSSDLAGGAKGEEEYDGTENRTGQRNSWSRSCCKSKGGKLSGKILSMLGVVIAVAGIILGGNLVLVVIGGVILGLGQMVQGKSKEQSDPGRPSMPLLRTSWEPSLKTYR